MLPIFTDSLFSFYFYLSILFCFFYFNHFFVLFFFFCHYHIVEKDYLNKLKSFVFVNLSLNVFIFFLFSFFFVFFCFYRLVLTFSIPLFYLYVLHFAHSSVLKKISQVKASLFFSFSFKTLGKKLKSKSKRLFTHFMKIFKLRTSEGYEL